MRIAAIRLKGKFSISPRVKSALSSLMLNRLYACTLLPPGETAEGMLRACKDVVSFGEVGKGTIELLLSARGKTLDGRRLREAKKPEEISKMAADIDASQKKLQDFGLSPVFFLAPPRGGFGSRKMSAPFGPAGKNPRIGELIARMA